MTYSFLGKSDLSVSATSFGCMSLGSDHASNEKLLHRAIDGGINFFDTADIYQKGFNEVTVGKAFRANRNKVYIATKVGNQARSDGNGWDWNPTKSYILASVEESLKRLGTDYIDLYQLHGGTIDDPIDETIEAFELLKAQGKIRHYGISSIRPNVIREYVKRSGIVSVMMQYSLLDRRPEEECLPLLQQNNIGVLTRGSLASGLLISKPPKEYLNHSAVNVARAATMINDLSKNGEPTAMALQFVLRNKAVTSAVVGIRSEEQLAKAIRQSSELTDAAYSTLNTSIPANTYDNHR